jgi:hypothetical protein
MVPVPMIDEVSGKRILKMLEKHDDLWQEILQEQSTEQERISWAGVSIYQAIHGLLTVHGDYGEEIIQEVIRMGRNAAKEAGEK